MKTIIAILSAGLFSGISIHVDAADNQTQRPVNFYLFTNEEKKITDELLAKTPEAFRNHPDLGKLPAGSPCLDCYEEVSKRQADSRYFIANSSNGTHFFKQQAVGSINYRDGSGLWREINPRLQVPVVPGEFHASRQPDPVTIDMNGKFCSIESNGYKIEFNRVLELFHLDNQRNLTPLGNPNWSNYTAGDDGVKVTDLYPGIDLELIVYEGKLKTNIILNNKLSYTDGWLIMKQQFNLPAGLKMDGSVAMLDERGKLKGEVPIVNESNYPVFTIQSSLVHDNNESSQSKMIASADFNKSNQFFVYVPCSWLASPSLVYPVTIDPMITASQSMAQAAITGSAYTNICYSGGCTYNMPSIAIPPSCTVTNVTTTFSYTASNLCTMKDGGMIVHYGACRAPSTMAFLNGTDLAGNANIAASLMPYIKTCIPAPQCGSYNMDFSMDFYRCQDNQAGCNTNCISANAPWVVTVEGHLVEINSITPGHIICTGGNTSMKATASYGVGPYVYSWSPGGAGQTVSVSPPGSTVYVCTATDACGNTAGSNCSVTVTGSAPAAVSITPGGPVCTGNNITFTATPNNGGSAPNYDWYVRTTLQQSGPSNTFITSASLFDSVTVRMTSNSACATAGIASAVVQFAPTMMVSMGLMSNPPIGPYCAGQTVVLTATPGGSGPLPIIGWGDGVFSSDIFLWSTSRTFSYIVQNGVKTFRAWLVADEPCVDNDTLSSPTLSIAGTMSVQPDIFITNPGVPGLPACNGSPLNFTTGTMHGGAFPAYQWYVNGIAVAGATYPSRTFTSLLYRDTVSVVLTSTAACALTITDTAIYYNRIDTSVSQISNVLNSMATGNTWQWLYCDSNMQVIPGATGMSYTAVVNGFYAVQIIQNGCTDTSFCHQVLGVGIPELPGQKQLLIYPNPVFESLTIQKEALANGAYEIELVDLLGKSVRTELVTVTDRSLFVQFSVKALSPGIYFLRVTSESFHRIMKIMKQ